MVIKAGCRLKGLVMEVVGGSGMTKLIDCPVCKKKDRPVREDAKVCCSSCRVKQWRLNKAKFDSMNKQIKGDK